MLTIDPTVAKSLWGDVSDVINWQHQYWWTRDIGSLPKSVFRQNPVHALYESCRSFGHPLSRKRISLVVSTAISGQAPTDVSSIPPLSLHHCCLYKVPLPLFRLLLQQPEHKCQVYERDSDGEFPIHLAITQMKVGCCIPQDAKQYAYDTMKALLRFDSLCAMTVDAQGRTPLEFALRNGPIHPSFIYAIVKANPWAIEAPSSYGGSLFYDIALSYSAEQANSYQYEPKDILSLYFNLLRDNPTLLGHLLH